MVGGPSLNPGRDVAWPLIVGGAVLAVAWTAWQVAKGHSFGDAISTAASGLAAFAVAVVCIVVLMNLLMKLGAWLGGRHPRFISLDWVVPVAAALGLLLGLAVWR